MRLLVSGMLILTMSAALTVNAQLVTFNACPQDFQLYPRDEQDSSAVPVSGVVHESGFNTAQLVIRRDGQDWRTFAHQLVYSGDTAVFAFAPKIPAELVNHRFLLQLDGMTVLDVDSVVCGDVVVMNGQSNAVASGPTGYNSDWIRTYGGMWTDAATCAADTTWDIALSSFWPDMHAGVGVWGVVVGNRLSGYLDMPVAVVNGAVGGTAILAHQRNDSNPGDLNTIYGRLYFRLHRSGLWDHVRAIFWHQGESDTYAGYAQFYSARWDALYQDWHEDYPALGQIYAFQIRAGVGDDEDEIREIQRRWPASYDNVHVMSTAGINGFDGLHFSAVGYQAFGELIWPLAARDLYSRSLEPNSLSPDLVRARYITASQDRIALEFSQAVSWPADSLGQELRDYIYLDDAWGMVQSGTISTDNNHTLVLQLDGPRIESRISYLDENLLTHAGGVYQGPWIRNPGGVGALIFDDVPIEPAVKQTVWSQPIDSVVRGDSLHVFVRLENTLGQPVMRQIWAEVELANSAGNFSFGPYQRVISPEGETTLRLDHVVPLNTPLATHQYRVMSGSYPDLPAVADTLYIQVLAP